MKQTTRTSVVLLTTALWFSPQLSAATQTASPTAQQYALAERYLPENIAKLAYRLHIQPQWVQGKSGVFWYYRDDAEQPRYELVFATEKKREALFDHAALTQALAAASAKPQENLHWRPAALKVADDLQTLEFRYQGKRWEWQRKEGKLKEISDTPAAAPATRSPDGKWDVVVKAGNLWLKEVSSGKERQLTTDGTPETPYAQPLMDPKLIIDGKHKQASDVTDLSWSPDSTRIATFRMDLRDAATLTLMQSSPPDGSLRPKTFTYPYALSGDTRTASAALTIIRIADGQQITPQLAPQAMLYYGDPDYRWSADSRHLLHFRPARGYASIDLFKIDADTGATTLLVQEKAEPYADYYGHRYWLREQQNEIYWTSDAGGWKHYYLYDAQSGKQLAALTSGNWRAGDILQFDDANKQVILTGMGREPARDPYLRHVYRVGKDGSKLRLLTPEALDHDVSVSPDTRYLVDNMSAVNQPTRTVLRDGDSGKILMELEQADISRLLATGFRLPEPFSATAADGKTPLYGVLYYPVRARQRNRYPVIDNIYTGPHTTYAPKSFARALRSSALPLTALDFAVVYVDGRGTTRRSREFLNYAFNNLGANGYEDHEVAIRALAAQKPLLDVNRVGIFGFSAGGYDTARAMFTRPDFYKVGWAASGNHDHRSDKAVWNEQWMGGPALGAHYDRDSNLTAAKNLKGRLMIAHGELDNNVNPMASLQLVNALIKAGKDFDMLIVPNGDHFLDDSAYYNRRRWDYFIRHLQQREPLPLNTPDTVSVK